ncbi:hypothetical protein Val02_09400 [Virgisporangium aliadipatigenens]|uniref:Uncharacterized protein n=1 Tax=Virgisporangium aliadipatigenens TaxID=741659 RepID=A0A8J3YF81_9ACTN|nr:hypothetical protein [Virgisporangium aliadipatigenens]GIJ44054.1 hypothetical protein Val02_09400 [Virgisporangium aliadipatigenens]
MFRNLVSPPGGSPDEGRVLDLLEAEPERVGQAIDFWWLQGRRPAAFGPVGRASLMWDHLIYAYMIENTRIFEIVQRVVADFRSGERLGIPQRAQTYRWLETTEELFYKDASPFLPRAQVSRIRPDIRANRRNAYYRMFGMDLNHGADTGPYPYERPAAANRGFIPALEEFLRLVWVGIENAGNTAGANPTDDAGLADLGLRLRDMLMTRRGGLAATLSREEFDYVATMSWLHLTVLFDTPVVMDLQAGAASPEERLRAMGERVGLPAHAQSHSYFILASALSTLFRMIEAGWFTDTTTVPGLYLTVPVRNMMTTIVTQWSLATGRDLKASTVVLTRRGGDPAPPPALSAGASIQPLDPAASVLPVGRPTTVLRRTP